MRRLANAPSVRMLAVLLAPLALSAACEREPRTAVCPDLVEGDLVVTEIRGDQSGTDDTFGEWIELYNASGAAIDLTGVAVRVTRLDGGSAARLVFRREVVVQPGEYMVLGRFFDFQDTLPGYVQYGYAADFDSSLYDTAAVEVFACGLAIDVTVYRDLPSTGTLALNGAIEPEASSNDTLDAWCNDQDSGAPDATGTPGEGNVVCPLE